MQCKTGRLLLSDNVNPLWQAGSFAGMGYLSMYLAGKLSIFDRQGHSWKVLPVILPLLGAVFVGVSRIDDYWHHWTDVFAGAILGECSHGQLLLLSSGPTSTFWNVFIRICVWASEFPFCSFPCILKIDHSEVQYSFLQCQDSEKVVVKYSSWNEQIKSWFFRVKLETHTHTGAGWSLELWHVFALIICRSWHGIFLLPSTLPKLVRWTRWVSFVLYLGHWICLHLWIRLEHMHLWMTFGECGVPLA